MPEPTPEALAELLYTLGRAMWTTNCTREAINPRMSEPRPGDLVIEVTRTSRTFDPDSIGRLLRIEGDRYVIEPLLRPGAEQGWQNATLVALPDRRPFHDWLTEERPLS